MIPYFASPSLHLPLGQEVNAFGVLVAIGIWVGATLGARAARNYQPGEDKPLVDVTPWAVIGGLLGGHLLHVFGYHPELLREQGIGSVLKFWVGLSSMGGVLGALLAIWAYFRRKRLRLLPYVDALALGTAPGWAIARIGCFLVHDHPGVHTRFPLAVAFPDGPRHDLGLYDFFVLAALSLILYGLARTPRSEGLLMGVLAVGYSVPRFFLDFWRAYDVPDADGRYFGLTPAQYIVIALFILGLRLIFTAKPYPTPSPRLVQRRAR